MLPTGLLPPGYTGYVAGGWAACPALAVDMDIWVYVSGSIDKLIAARGDIAEHIEDSAESFTRVEPATLSFPSAGVDGYSSSGHVVKVGKGIWKGKTLTDDCVSIEVMVTNLLPEDLVETFDISTHALAITDDGRVVKGLGWEPITVSPSILRNTPTTLARLIKIGRRYGHTMGYDALNNRQIPLVETLYPELDGPTHGTFLEGEVANA